MNSLAFSFISSIIIGIGATLTFDLWTLFLQYVFKITPSNICMIGRWLRHMPEGTFTHPNIVSSPRKSAECTVGWMGHYMIGIIFATTFLALAGSKWLQLPTPAPAMVFGVVTVLAPFMIMQPALGLGIAASKTSNPAQARLRSLTSHTAFGVGIYLSGLLVRVLL